MLAQTAAAATAAAAATVAAVAPLDTVKSELANDAAPLALVEASSIDTVSVSVLALTAVLTGAVPVKLNVSVLLSGTAVLDPSVKWLNNN